MNKGTLLTILMMAPAAYAFETPINVSVAPPISPLPTRYSVQVGTAGIWEKAIDFPKLPADVRITWTGTEVQRRQIRVQACNDSGCSGWTSPVNIVLSSLTVAPAFSGTRLPIVIDTEHPQTFDAYQHHAWDIVAAPAGFQGSGVAQVLPDDGSTPLATATNNPMLGYRVWVAAAGSYTVWVRAAATSGTNDSVWIGVDGVLLDRAANYRAYTWIKLAALAKLTAGTHTLNLYMREAGTVVDRLLLTTDAAYIPSATVALAESERVGAVPAKPILRVSFE